MSKKFSGERRPRHSGDSHRNPLRPSNSADTSEDAAASTGEGYTVIVRGLTTDLAAIYRDALPRFMLPRVPIASDFTSTSVARAESVAGGNQQQQQQQQDDPTSSPTTTATMRPISGTSVAFRVETLSAFVSVPEDEAKRALLRSVASQQRQRSQSAAAQQQQQKSSDAEAAAAGAVGSSLLSTSSSASAPQEALVQYCKGRELFGQKCDIFPAESNHDQSGLATAPCVLSKKATRGALHNAMLAVPGYVSVIPQTAGTSRTKASSSPPPSSKYRLVFRNQKVLFEAKKLLDEFPLSEDIKVTVNLNDNATRKYMEFVRGEEDIVMGGADE